MQNLKHHILSSSNVATSCAIDCYLLHCRSNVSTISIARSNKPLDIDITMYVANSCCIMSGLPFLKRYSYILYALWHCMG